MKRRLINVGKSKGIIIPKIFLGMIKKSEHVNEIDIEILGDHAILSINPEKKNHTPFVRLKETEYETLVKVHGFVATESMIQLLSNYKACSGKTYKSDYHAILCWVVQKYKKECIYNKQPYRKATQEINYEQRAPRAGEFDNLYENLKGDKK